LTGGQAYTFKVTPVNVEGVGLAGSTTITVGSPTVPGVPTGIHATAAAGSATLAWVAPASGSATITTYVVTPLKAGVVQPAITVAGTVTARTMTGLTSGASYTFKVAARNVVGTGLQSALSNAIVPT
jgi:hypothetical protein